MRRVYHEVSPGRLAKVLENGLHCTSRGDKGDGPAIIRTDQLLDSTCPPHLKQQSLSRDNNLYAYLPTGDAVIDITDGAHVPLDDFISGSSQKVLALDIDPARCFVSDLDAFDQLKTALTNQKPPKHLAALAVSYWQAIQPLQDFSHGEIRRPEVMITYDVPPQHIQVL